MLSVVQLTDKEMKLIYDGLMGLNHAKYDKEDRECIIKMKNELRIEADKRPYTVKQTWYTYEKVDGEYKLIK
jgi:hypothetical protein